MTALESASVHPVERWAATVLQGVGVAEAEARTVVDSLAFAERRGVRTHGFVRLGIYLERIEAGGIDPAATPVVVSEQGAVAVLDCRGGPGAVGAAEGVVRAAALARAHGIGLVLGRDGNHFGAAGYYAERLAEEGLFALVSCNTDIVMAPPSGGRRVLGTNPLAMAWPAEVGGIRPLLDMATTEVALGRLIVSARNGDPIPTGWAFDEEGHATTDPEAGLRGALAPAAGPKGFGLAYMLDLLCAAGGAEPSPDVGALYGDRAVRQRLGFAILAIDPPLASEEVAARARRLHEVVHAGGPAGGPEPLVPGEPEQAHERRNGGGYALPQSTIEELEEIGARHGVPFPGWEKAMTS